MDRRTPGALDAPLAAVAAGGVLTVLVVVAPTGRFVYRSPSAHVAIETAAAVIALAAAVLALGRLGRTSRRSDLALAVAFLFSAGSLTAFATVPAAVNASTGGAFPRWAALTGGLLAALAYAAAALGPDARITRPRRAGALAVVGVLGTIAAIALATAVFGDELPPPVSPIDPPEDNGVPLAAHPGTVAMYAVALAAYAGAAVGFARRAERTGDPLMSWLAAGMVLAGFARLNYALFPTAYSAWVYTGDILRICSSLALFAGLAAEVARYERGMARAAVLDDRRRIARDLHDGLAQELSFIANESRRARRAPGVPERESAVLDRIATAAQRALDESRDAILALSRDDDEPLDAALARAAEDVAGRMGGDVRLELDPRAELAPAARDALVRIVREAMTNAFRHGRASAVEVTLSVGSGIRLEVSDDGAGFDPAAEERGGGFGLTSMRERAEALGGELLVMSRPGEGARVEVVLP